MSISLSTLSDWDQAYDDNLCPYRTSDKRGTATKVTMEIIRHIVDKARALKERGNRLRITKFVQTIKDELQLDLGLKTIKDILIANDLWRPQTKKKRPEFYQSLCQQIPNGVLSLDGSTINVHVGDLVMSYNLELGVDAGSFCHTAYEITPTETGDGVLSVLKKHQEAWGLPLGVVFDRGSANLSEEVMSFLSMHDIIILPAGPRNPKGNGTDEGAFSQFKQAIGEVHIDTSSPYALGESVLKMLVCLYMQMRNKLALRKPRPTPADQMQTPVSAKEQEKERARLIEHQQKKDNDAHQAKRDRLHWLINYHDITLSPIELQRAEYCIKGYDQEAITKSEEAFLRAVNRDHNRCNLSYFFGILSNIQQDLDDQRYQQYCQERYSYELHQENQRRKAEIHSQNEPTVESVLNLVVTALDLSQDFLQKSAFNKCKERIEKLLSSVSYISPLMKRFHDALGARDDLDVKQKEQALNQIEQLINETAAA